MSRLILIYLCICVFQTSLQGQTKSAFLKAAEKSYTQSDFHSSLVYYLEAYAYDTTQVDIIRAVAESARKANVYRTAENYYQKLMDLEIEQQLDEDPFWLAYSKQKQGKYEEAKMLYSIYLTEYADDDLYLSRRADKEIKSCEWALTEINNPRENVNIRRLNDQINDVQYADFAPVIDGTDLTFSSLRYRIPASKKSEEQLVSKRLQTDQSEYVDEIYETLASDNLFVGHTATNNAKTKIYYTLCAYHSGYQIKCDLYTGQLDTDGSVSQTSKLPESVNHKTSNNTQPAYYSNTATGDERLYYVSDRPGGKGGLDIWYVSLANNSAFNNPVNASQLNTTDNEITPFYHAFTNELFFSSDGYLGLGGYDIYKLPLEDEASVKKPIHLGTPINSSYNDIYYVLNETGNEAYFSTNRFKTNYHDNDTEPCCYDIYKSSVDNVIIQLNAKTFQRQNMDSVELATVDLFYLESGDLIKTNTPAMGIDHIFELTSDREYMLIGRKKGYGSDTTRISTVGIYETQVIDRSLFLDLDYQKLEISVYDEFTFEPVPNSKIILKNLSDPNAPDIILDSGVEYATTDIDPFASYEVTISKEGYEEQSFTIYPGDDLSTEILRRKVYLKPVLFSIYLPTLLYFDNDRPDPRTLAETTTKRYTEAYEPYIDRKNVFIRQIQNSSEFKGDRQNEIGRLELFFEQDVKGGYATFQKFLDAVQIELQKGFGFEILLKGFTSPLAQDEYNKNLGKRRVMSIQNEIRNYKNAMFLPAIDSGMLKITDVSYGEEQAPASVIDSPNRPAQSIYSTDASRERRVEIIEVRRIFKNRNSK